MIRRRKHRCVNNCSASSKSTKQYLKSEIWLEEKVSLIEEPIVGPPIIKLLMSSEWTMFLGLLALRSVNALVIQTAFVPDEYWQSVEVAHKMAYG